MARWLGDIRTYFPSTVVQVMQKDAIEKLNLTRLLLEPEMLEAVEPDVHLAGTLLALNKVMPDQARESARALVRRVVEELERRLAQKTRAAVSGALDRSARTHRPRRVADIDWDRTIRANLKNYLPDRNTVVPVPAGGLRAQAAVGAAGGGAVRRPERVDGGLGGCIRACSGRVLASMRSLRTSLVVFDTAVGGSHRSAARPGGGAVRHPARRRHRHQPRRRLLPGPHHPAGELDLHPDQ
ncbi:hypothetical protein GCM10020220_062320 [Nonomuraea rubra]